MGACTRQCDIERDDTLAASVPLLRQALAFVGHTQTRNRGTVGGSLVHADPSAELPLVAQILEARLVLRAKSGTRTVPAASFFAGPMTTIAAPDECLRGNPMADLARAEGRFGVSPRSAGAMAISPWLPPPLRSRWTTRGVAHARRSASAARRRRRSPFPSSRGSLVGNTSGQGDAAATSRRRPRRHCSSPDPTPMPVPPIGVILPASS